MRANINRADTNTQVSYRVPALWNLLGRVRREQLRANGATNQFRFCESSRRNCNKRCRYSGRNTEYGRWVSHHANTSTIRFGLFDQENQENSQKTGVFLWVPLPPPILSPPVSPTFVTSP